MPRIRTIKPEFPQSESMGRVSRDARLLFVLLWTLCDDEGRTRAASRMLASLLYPYDADAPELIEGWIAELEREKCVVRYRIEDQTYLQVSKWLIHQKIDKPSKSRIPPFDEGSPIPREPSANPRESSSEDQGRDQGRERKGPTPSAPSTQPLALVPDAPTPPPVAQLPLADGSEFGVDSSMVAEWSAAFPGVDVTQQLAQMRAWLLASPARRKTRRGVPKFVVGWLGREQNRPKPAGVLPALVQPAGERPEWMRDLR